MRIDGFYAVGRETPDGDVVFLQTYMAGSFRERNWGSLAYADRYLMFKDAKKAAEAAHTTGSPPAVWSVEVNARKESET